MSIMIHHKYEFYNGSSGHRLEGETTGGGITFNASAPGDGPCFDRGVKYVRITIPADALAELAQFISLAIKAV